MVTNSGVTRGGNSHEQAVGSQEGGNTVALLLVTDRQWCRSWLTAKTVFANRKWAKQSLVGKEACVP